MRSISLLSNAKINLFFSVHGLRPDGYCEVSSVILPVNFGDKLTFSKIDPPHTPPAIAINVRPPIRDFDEKNNTILTAIDHFPKATKLENIGLKIDIEKNLDNQNNTILTAIDHFQKITKLENIGLKIDIEKKIPIGGGFGGGSSNAICALNALNALYGNILPPAQYLQIARNIGVDCPFFIQNCPQFATGRGDILRPLPRSFRKILSSYSVLLFCPTFAISTRAAYDKLKQNFPTLPAEKIIDQPLLRIKNIENIAISTRAAYDKLKQNFPTLPAEKIINQPLLRIKNIENIAHNIFQDSVLDAHPPLKSLFQRLRKCGYHPCLTGSGSGCFIMHRDRHFLERAEPIITEFLGALRLLAITNFRATDV
ncbi:MAG: hypothetical protein LBG09_02035 [Puniceicoccales bacterium]|jgi:4-diphosphocytidyl-2C-methyl-D-erythritol kinase|nr:hypothetical protein [Puniceicoccales bacterium]